MTFYGPYYSIKSVSESSVYRQDPYKSLLSLLEYLKGTQLKYLNIRSVSTRMARKTLYRRVLPRYLSPRLLLYERNAFIVVRAYIFPIELFTKAPGKFVCWLQNGKYVNKHCIYLIGYNRMLFKDDKIKCYKEMIRIGHSLLAKT